MSDNLKKLGKTYNWLIKELNEFNLKPNDILIATYDGEGKIFVQAKEKKK